ncbi:single-stranded-DNA-specific exonuclease RecJ [Candidatus Bandiella numerosa]|uniref:single-stranded-DNA-specific exonuclease RecJ n=1 Tax=Candidatus Bandiella numerosa TaxID=2570586 RepID=UPI001F01C2F6|nr:single-stranded-DNA-specific exonuclease RecJ [Candidatus Bandiella numerosa]
MNNEKNYGTKSSYKNLHWELQGQSEKDVLHFVQKFGISDIIARVLLNRGINDAESVQNFLYPKIKNLMPNPFLMRDMDKAANRIVESIKAKEKIVMYADYDVDGATSSAVLKRFFYALGLETTVYIPCRFKEGYGPNKEAFKKLIDQGNDLIITVDCGTVAFEPIKYAQGRGVDVIIIDHHIAQENLPESYAVVNPNRLDDDFKFKDIAAVGVVFFVITAIRSILRQKGYFQEKNITEPDIMEYLDLVALGTVCDVMPLTGINRAFVQHGLRLINKKQNLGLKVLAECANIDIKSESYHLGYILGPRINAGGRVGKGYLGSVLLSTNSYQEAYDSAKSLEKYNQQRKSIESIILEQVLANIRKNNFEENSVILAYGEDWHYGVLGILASKVKEKYQKPALIISINDGIGKGSARSIKGIDIGKNITIAKEEGLLIEGGGHEMAGGFSIEKEKIESFYQFLLARILKNNNHQEIYQQAKVLKIDALISVGSVNSNLLSALKIAEPFGQGNEKPKFMIVDAIICKVWTMAVNHITLVIKDGIYDDSSKSIKCVLFNGTSNKYGSALLRSTGKKISLVGNLQPNFFNKDKVDFIIEDFSFDE